MRRTKADIQAGRQRDWESLAHGKGFSMFTCCTKCQTMEQCRGKTRHRVKCYSCHMSG